MILPGARRPSTAVPGDGRALKNYGLKHISSRTLFFLELVDTSSGPHEYAVDVDYYADEIAGDDEFESTESPVALYQDGVQVLRSDLPAVFPVPGGQIEVAARTYGLRRMHYVHDNGEQHVLRPHPSTPEGLRAVFGRSAPRASVAIGRIAALVILTGLALTIPQLLETVTASAFVAERIGSFASPIHLPAWVNTMLVIATTLAGIERALTLRSHWLLDIESTWGEEE